MRNFSEKVAAGLEKCGIGFSSNPPSLLLAVSGGIDSMAMLYALNALSDSPCLNGAPAAKPILSVVTVNHNIRPACETEADTALVQSCCAAFNIPCFVETVPPGAVEAFAVRRGAGIEEAARFVRYGIFEKIASGTGADFVLLAHNRDDQLETLLQRFFQGASAGISGKAAAGIARRRGIFCRPLLDIPRSLIQSYAEAHNIPFREDRTNADPSYYRNNLRLSLVPLLNERFSGWDTGVLSGAEKACETADFIEHLALSIVWKPVYASDGVSAVSALQTGAEAFFAAGFPVRIRALYKAVEKIGMPERVPYALLKAFAEGQKRVRGAGLQMYAAKRFIFIQKETEPEKGKVPSAGGAENGSAYCREITEAGTYTLPFGTVEVRTPFSGKQAAGEEVQKTAFFADNKYGEVFTGPFKLPVTVRSFFTGGSIQTADGKHKSLKKIRSEWGIAPLHENLIPVIEYSGVPVCIWGEPLGYPSWYVKDCAADPGSAAVFIFKKNL